MQQHKALEGVTAIRLSINHIKHLLLHPLARSIASRPIVTRAHSMFAYEEVFRVVDVLVRSTLDTVDNSRLKINQDGAGNVASVVALVEEDIFAITAFSGKVFKLPVATDAMLLTELLPELTSDIVAALFC